MKTILLILTLTALLIACNSNPKVIEAVDTSSEAQAPMGDQATTKLHKVVVVEVLPTEKYSYLSVTEDGEPFWIAIPKKDIEVGGTYYYRGGLKKTNFKSVEYDRVFETVYLVSDVSKDPGMSGMASGGPHEKTVDAAPMDKNTKIAPPPGGITIAELYANRNKYDGQTIKVKGQVVKLNNMIMNRNWIHIQDGSGKTEVMDLTITTNEEVQMGAVVAFEGKIALNKDFGAGYKYEIILEDAKLLP